jgi:hypothetical protein
MKAKLSELTRIDHLPNATIKYQLYMKEEFGGIEEDGYVVFDDFLISAFSHAYLEHHFYPYVYRKIYLEKL